jgi:hypothetical protein
MFQKILELLISDTIRETDSEIVDIIIMLKPVALDYIKRRRSWQKMK